MHQTLMASHEWTHISHFEDVSLELCAARPFFSIDIGKNWVSYNLPVIPEQGAKQGLAHCLFKTPVKTELQLNVCLKRP